MTPDDRNQRYIIKADNRGVAVFDTAEEVTVKYYSTERGGSLDVAKIVANHVAEALNLGEQELAG